MLHVGMTVTIGGTWAKKLWYEEAVGLTGQVYVPSGQKSHLVEFQTAPCCYVLVDMKSEDRKGEYYKSSWYIAEVDCIPAYIGENTEAVMLLREGDPYE